MQRASFLVNLVLPLICSLLCSNTSQAQPAVIKPGDRVVFLGDSNTYAGQYIAYLEAQLAADFEVDLINLGLSSETASGLSEPDHPFPRPCVLDRLDGVLSKSKPDVVVACYGMNDGIYYPFAADRFARYRNGMTEIIQQTKAAGANIVLMTPPPFDPLPMQKQGKLRGDDAEKYAWFAPYEKYDEVLQRYSQWVLEQDVDAKIDLHKAMAEHLAKSRSANPDFVMSGDGVHFDDDGHRFLAQLIGAQLGLPLTRTPTKQVVQRYKQRQSILRDAWLTYVGHKRPGVKKGLPLKEATARADALLEN